MTSPSEVYVPIMKAVNGIAVRGAHPVAVLLTLLLPADTEESFLRELMKNPTKRRAFYIFRLREVTRRCRKIAVFRM